jgi:hypothetical protein
MSEWAVAGLTGGVMALCALFTLAGALGMHFYQRGKFDARVSGQSRAADVTAATAIGKLEVLTREFQQHVADDAAALGELKALVGVAGRDQLAMEGRFTAAIESVGRALTELGRDLRNSMDGLSERLDRAMERRD